MATAEQATTELPSLELVAEELPQPPDHVIVLFGASGDLARRKLLPGLFHLFRAGFLGGCIRIIGVSRRPLNDEAFRERASEALEEFGRDEVEPGTWARFAGLLSAASLAEGAGPLVGAVAAAEAEVGCDVHRLHFLAVPPAGFGETVELLAETGLNRDARVVVEKPFGYDLASARELNATLHSAFEESQVCRIDHFLGKEAVQNILALRFANGLYEPIWNRNAVANVQIDVPETIPVSSSRADFYERTGAIRDMIVTHLFQVLSFVAMEPPVSMSAKALLDEKVKVFNAMRPVRPEDVVRGQYRGYRDGDGVASDSTTETFAAARLEIDTWRWSGVPFYVRTGKRLAASRRLVTLTFREPPQGMFPGAGREGRPNQLVFELTEPGVISADFSAKVPGAEMRLGPARMTFRYEESFATERQLDAYERLLLDAMIGDLTLFTRADGIERIWELNAPVLDDPPPVHEYEPGSWGPEAAAELIAPARWRLPD